MADVVIRPQGVEFDGRTYPIVDGLSMPTPERRWFEQWRVGGIGCVNTTVAVWENASETLALLGKWRHVIAANSDLVAHRDKRRGDRGDPQVGPHRDRVRLPEHRAGRAQHRPVRRVPRPRRLHHAAHLQPAELHRLRLLGGERHRHLVALRAQGDRGDEQGRHPDRPVALRRAHHARSDRALGACRWRSRTPTRASSSARASTARDGRRRPKRSRRSPRAAA